MKKRLAVFFSACLFLTIGCTQNKIVNTFAKPDSNQVYLFYLHGGIVQQYGINAVSPHFGKYEYTAIIGTLENHGFNVLSEVRPKETIEKEYAVKVKSQVDSLIELGVAPTNIVIAGASQGAYKRPSY